MASTCKSGSEMVIRKPSRKPTPMMRKRFWLRVSMEPTRSPMGVMLISAPRVKNMMPTMIMAAPSRKQSRMLGETGGDAETEDQHDGRDGQDGLQRLQQLFPELGEG